MTVIKWQKKKRFVMNVVKTCGYVTKHFINGNIKASIIVAKLAMLKIKCLMETLTEEPLTETNKSV